ncbi:hypothetical protein Patl1_07137 [Pistacia atlantica]|uniref:Uncharacterized protein n=1 Tax=Pistacia atlantica TaxID=434234 RepID=A0ACC1AIX1_9ROSI|nr:hypothetical protein Patl1_07137 [Pistacia atlantica]
MCGGSSSYTVVLGVASNANRPSLARNKERGEFIEGDEMRMLPQCGHGFHVVCIDKWWLHTPLVLHAAVFWWLAVQELWLASTGASSLAGVGGGGGGGGSFCF